MYLLYVLQNIILLKYTSSTRGDLMTSETLGGDLSFGSTLITYILEVTVAGTESFFQIPRKIIKNHEGSTKLKTSESGVHYQFMVL